MVETLEGLKPCPCGRCPECVARRASWWSFRLMEEEKISESAYFITMTYDTDHVPITKNCFLTVCKKDLQDYFKRLRYAHSGSNFSGIRYYAVGEYGGRKKRPHYHIILFNADLRNMFDGQSLLALEYSCYNGKVHVMQKDWNKGTTTVGKVEGASVGYVLKYLTKVWKPMHVNDDREPQFSIMSKGLGESYLGEFRKFWHGKLVKLKTGEECIEIKYGKRLVKKSNIYEWHKKDLDNRMLVNIGDGKISSMPRYYRERIYSEMQLKRVNHLAVVRAKENEDKVIRGYIDAGLSYEDYVRDKNEARVASFRMMESKSKQYEKI